MRVTAFRKGFHDGTLRYAGDKFEVSKEEFSPRWMRRLSRGKEVVNAPEDEMPVGIKERSAVAAAAITVDQLAEAVGLKRR
jgi:hypothetical protein